MKATAVVCTRDRPHLLAVCLPGLLANTHRPREVLVVDQSRDGQTWDVVRAVAVQRGDAADVRYIPTATRGLSAARNVAVAQATGEVIAFTDDDCLVDPGWLAALVGEFAAGPTLAAVCGRSLPLVETPLVAEPASVRTGQTRRHFSRPCSPWRIGNGSNMAFRAGPLRALRAPPAPGPFDERLGPGAPFRGGEEADVLYRLLKQGCQVLYSPAPLVHHRQWRSPAQQLALATDYGVGIGAYCAKHLRGGDVRPLRSLGGWTLATAADLVAALRAGDAGRTRAAVHLLAGLAAGAGRMALAGRGGA
jgi:glycosyltransferase involved in cell wall biosynthesis